jgi:hypothetical protein
VEISLQLHQSYLFISSNKWTTSKLLVCWCHTLEKMLFSS